MNKYEYRSELRDEIYLKSFKAAWLDFKETVSELVWHIVGYLLGSFATLYFSGHVVAQFIR